MRLVYCVVRGAAATTAMQLSGEVRVSVVCEITGVFPTVNSGKKVVLK